VDNLRAGMVFINDGTATYGFVSAANNLSSSTLPLADLGSVVVQPTALLPGTAISTAAASDTDNYNDGTDVRFKLGTITNTATANSTVSVATTGNLAGFAANVITGVATSIDGVALALNDFVLVKNQTTASQNGIYQVTSLGGTATLTRATFFDESVEVTRSYAARVTNGTVNAGLLFFQQTPSVVLNTSNIVWSTDDAFAEQIVIEFNALVLNVTASQSGTTISNSFDTRLTDTVVGAASANANVVVAEPTVTLAKTTAATGTVDAGDTFTYTITVANTASGVNAAPAFDVRLTDVLDAITTTNPSVELELVTPPSGTGDASVFTGSSVAVTGLGSSTVIANASASTGLDLTLNRVDAGQSVTFTVTVRVVTGALAGAEVQNTANVTYTSLPGGAGTASAGIATTYATTLVDLNPGTDSVLANADANNGTVNLAGAAAERTGADGVGGALNDYAATATSGTINVAGSISIGVPTIDLSWQDGTVTANDSTVTSSLLANTVIGETVTLDVRVTMPEGVTNSTRVAVVLPNGLRLDGYSFLTTSAATSLLAADFAGSFGSTPAPATPATGTVTFNFGNVTTTADNTANNNAFVIRLTAIVTDILTNQVAVTLSPTASLTFSDPDSAGNNTNVAADRTIADANAGNNPVLTLVEPTLTIVKGSTLPLGGQLDAGDPLE
jgi:fimbrial isopeptide formation D2 family protein